jgi:hypothetical protein
MPSNTAKRDHQAVNFPNFSVEKRAHNSDRFTMRDDHCVGTDGFVVPRDFKEFYNKFPDYVHKWVSKHADRSAPKEDIEDWTQDLLIHLCYLPQTSKYRRAGKEDLQTFDPVKHYGCNEARFRNYVNLCPTNRFRTMHSKRMKDALCRPGNVPLNGQAEDGDLLSADDEYCYSHSAHLQAAANASEKQSSDRAFIATFVEFVRRKDPRALPTIDALLATGTQADAADWLGTTEGEFGRLHNRSDRLGKSFLSDHWRPQAAVRTWRYSTRPLASGVHDRTIERAERSHHARTVGTAAGRSSGSNLQRSAYFRDRLEDRRRVRGRRYYQAVEAKAHKRRCPFRVASLLDCKKPGTVLAHQRPKRSLIFKN